MRKSSTSPRETQQPNQAPAKPQGTPELPRQTPTKPEGVTELTEQDLERVQGGQGKTWLPRNF